MVVCGPHIIIISVKENEYKDTGDKTGWKRWQKAAIEKSVSQIWGAERWLETVDEIVRHDGRKITLPEKNERQYHRVSVSLGGKGHVPLKWGDFGNGFVHVCDEYSVGVVFSALDTITDFVEFLTDTESLIKSGVQLSFAGIEDLVALFLSRGHSFGIKPNSPHFDRLILLDDMWEGFSKSDEYAEIKKDLNNSYIWDRLIEFYTTDLLTDGMFDMHSKEVTKNELALVIMALQPRSARAVLAESFIEFFENPELKVASRAVKGYEDTAFVFFVGKSTDREYRMKELFLRCLVIRGRVPGVIKVVGIATDRPGTSEIGYSSDIVYINLPNWTTENEEKVVGIQNDLGYFKNVQWA